VEDGIYSFAVIATNANGTEVDVETFTTGFVSAVGLENGSSTLDIGNLSLQPESILAVRDPRDFTN